VWIFLTLLSFKIISKLLSPNVFLWIKFKKWRLRQGSPEPHWGAYDAPRPPSRMEMEPLANPLPSTPSASRFWPPNLQNKSTPLIFLDDSMMKMLIRHSERNIHRYWQLLNHVINDSMTQWRMRKISVNSKHAMHIAVRQDCLQSTSDATQQNTERSRYFFV